MSKALTEKLSLQEVLKEFLFDCKLRKLSERTTKSYKNNNLSFFRYIETEYELTEVCEVSHKVIQAYVNYLADKGLKESYINGLIKCFRAFFTYCVNERYITDNPVDRVRSQKQPLNLINTFNDVEVKDMIKYYNGSRFLDIRNKFILIMLFDSGIRNSELCNLKLSDIRTTYINVLGKGKKIRHVPITASINKYLLKYRRVRENYIKDKTGYDTEYLFLSQKGKILTVETVERIILECGSACNVREEIRISPHTARHYYAQTQLKNGCDLYTLSRLLGHSKIDVTKIYLQSMEGVTTVEIGARTSPLNALAI